MKFITFIIFLEYIKISFSTLPLWNFTASSYDLLEGVSHEDDVSSYNIWGYNPNGYEQYRMHRKIYKHSNGSILQENTLYLHNLEPLQTEYEDIESAYVNPNGTYFICPKGRFHAQYFNKNNKTRGIIINESFKVKNNWDLKCFYQYNEHILFIGYTNSQYYFYSYSLYDEKFLYHININNGLYAYSRRTQTLQDTDDIKQMFAIAKDGDYFELKDLRINVKKGENFGYI